MHRIALALMCALFGAFLFSVPASAQSLAVLANGCGTARVSTNYPYLSIDTTGKLCTAASVSATVGGWTPNGVFATVTATGSSADAALPAGGTVDEISNTGTTAVSCNFTIGAGSATASQNVIQAGSTLVVTVGTSTHYSCIDQTGSASNVVVAAGGSGLGTGWGGGGGSSLNGTVSNASSGVATSSTNIGAVSWLYGYNGTTWDQLQVDGSKNLKVNAPITSWAGGTLGAMANYGTSPGTVLVPGVNAFVTNATPLGPVAASSSSPVTLPILNHASTTALGTSLVVKNSAGNLNAYNCTAITGGAAGFCIAYNGTTAPSTGALTGSLVLDYCYFDTTARGCSLAHANGSIAFSSGIVILVTSAASPYTYTTGTDTAAIEGDSD